MGNLRTTSSILSTIAASAADVSVSGHKVSITGCPTMDYRTIQNEGSGVDSSLIEQLQVTTVSLFGGTGAANTTYTLYISQFIQATNSFATGYLQHTTDATSFSATNICDAWRAQLVAQSGLKITGSGTSTLVLTAQAGNATFTVSNITPSSTTQVTASTITPVNINSSTVASPSVVTFSASHGLVVGNVITIVSADNARLASGTYRVASIPLATTATLYSVNGQTPLAGVTGTTTATVTVPPQRSRGTYADLVAAGVTGATVGATYSQLPITFVSLDGSLLGTTESNQSKHTLYILDGAANFAALVTRLTEVARGFASGGSVSDPNLINQI